MNEAIYAVIHFFENAPMVPVFGLYINLYLILAVCVALVWLLCYVLRSRALQRLSYDRWLSGGVWAWFPIGIWWVLGNIADDYSQKARGKRRHKRSWLLWLSVALALGTAILWILPVLFVLAWQGVLPEEVLLQWEILGVINPYLVVALPALWLVRLIFGIFALLNIYTSCDPDKAVTNLIVSILLPVSVPFILFACRNRSFGMPPEKLAMPIPNTWKPLN